MKASGEMILRKIAGEYILIPTGTTALRIHGMITMTESGILLWKKLKSDCTREELISAILSEYDIDRRTAETDVDAFLAKLDALQILDRSEADE